MFDNLTPEGIKTTILSKLPDWNTRSGSFADLIVSAAAYEIWQCYMAMNALEPMFFIDETSGIYIDKKCAEYGIERKAGERATVLVTVSGDAGTLIPKGSAFKTADNLAFIADGDVTISGSSAVVPATAEAVGAKYNVKAGAIVSAQHIISGVDAITNNEDAAGGADPETDASLVARFYSFLRTPATSGNAHHYEAWALETPGVGYARVVPLWAGAGTVKVIVCGPDGRSVDKAVTDAVSEHIEANRPIGASVTVESAQEAPMAVSAVVTTDGSATADTIKSEFEAAAKEYFASLVFRAETVSYNRIAFLLLSAAGVLDFSSLTLNGGMANVSINKNQIPVLGTVEVNILAS